MALGSSLASRNLRTSTGTSTGGYTGKMIETTPYPNSNTGTTTGSNITPATGLVAAISRRTEQQIPQQAQQQTAAVNSNMAGGQSVPSWVQALRQNISDYHSANPNLDLNDPTQVQSYHRYMISNLPQGAPSGLAQAMNQNYINRMQTLQQQARQVTPVTPVVAAGNTGSNTNQYRRVIGNGSKR